MINHFKNKIPKEDEIKRIVVDLENGIKDVFSSNNFKEYLKTMSKFHNYSVYNTMLIHLQNKDSTYVAGYNKWIELGRYVKKGSKAIKILAPVPHTQYVEQPKIDPLSNKPIEFNKIEGTSKGYYDPNNKLIKIKESMSEKQTIKTLIHELAHSKLHDNIINRNAAENEYINQGLSKNDIIFALSTIESDYDDLISIANSLLNKLKSIN